MFSNARIRKIQTGGIVIIVTQADSPSHLHIYEPRAQRSSKLSEKECMVSCGSGPVTATRCAALRWCESQSGDVISNVREWFALSAGVGPNFGVEALLCDVYVQFPTPAGGHSTHPTIRCGGPCRPRPAFDRACRIHASAALACQPVRRNF